MMNNEHVSGADELDIDASHAFIGADAKLRTITRVTNTRAYFEGGSCKATNCPADAEIIAKIESRDAKRADERRISAQRQKEREAEQATRAADPRLSLIDKLKGDWHPWEKLTLEQLQTVYGWISGDDN